MVAAKNALVKRWHQRRALAACRHIAAAEVGHHINTGKFGYGLFSVILKIDGELIGDCGLEQMDVEGIQAAELGYDFRSDYWNKGFATEAAIAVNNESPGPPVKK